MTQIDSGHWLSITDLARERGVSKQAVSVRVKRLMQAGRLTPRAAGPGEATMINVAEYDTATNLTASLRSQPEPVSLSSEQSRKVGYEADLAEIKLKEMRGLLIETASVVNAMTAAAEIIVRQLDQMPSRADEMSAAIAADGVVGARSLLKAIARDMRDGLARSMRLQVTAALDEADAHDSDIKP